MPRKVFLSVLGSSNYKTSSYTDAVKGYVSEPVRFVQEATLCCTGIDWTDDDRIFIFVTKGEKGSRARNWNDDGHPDECGTCEGLKTRITAMGLIGITKDIDIPDGNTEQEIREIFTIIYGCLESGDEIYFDITHGFRFVPMLVLVLSNYSKFLKNSEIRQITYGNYDGRDQLRNESPIINLTFLAELQDWTMGAQEFINLGKTFGLSRLVNKMGDESDKTATPRFREFAKALTQLEGDFYTVRGKRLVSGEVIRKIHDSIRGLNKYIPAGPLDPIIGEINKKIEAFSRDSDLINGFLAVEWCRKHKLIQQAYTLGQEIIISFVCKYFGLNDNDRSDREYVGKVLGISKTRFASDKSSWARELMLREGLTEELLIEDLILELADEYHDLARFRNLINHGGFHGNDKWDDFEKNFDKFYDRCILVLKRHGLDLHAE